MQMHQDRKIIHTGLLITRPALHKTIYTHRQVCIYQPSHIARPANKPQQHLPRLQPWQLRKAQHLMMAEMAERIANTVYCWPPLTEWDLSVQEAYW